MKNVPHLPTFAIIGRSNEGKTTLMATLTEDDRLEMGEVPGMTREATPYPLKIDEEPVMYFWDTPGFQNTAKTHEWFTALERGVENPASEFIAKFGAEPDFINECELLKPVSQGAAIIYLVDASNMHRQTDLQQLEILRRCGNPRIAVVYSKKGDERFADKWKQELDAEVNTRRQFNAHTATFRDRIELLKAVANVSPDWQPSVAESIKGLELMWQGKKTQCAAEMIKLLKKVLDLKVTEVMRDPDDKERAGKEAEKNLGKKIREMEKGFQKKVRKIFRHSTDHWNVEDSLGGDLFSEEVWRIFGLTRVQLAFAGGLTGAIIGGIIDGFTGGASFMMGTILGAPTGAAIAWFSAKQFAKIKFPNVNPTLIPRLKIGPIRTPRIGIPFRGGPIAGAQAQAWVRPQSNLIYILLDRGLRYIELASQWAHGKQEGKIEVSLNGENASITKNWAKLGPEIAAVSTLTGQMGREKGKRKEHKLEEAERNLKGILINELDTLIG